MLARRGNDQASLSKMGALSAFSLVSRGGGLVRVLVGSDASQRGSQQVFR
jgi:hypothetical protein